jgi:antitoxin (DNA-binding transcriptional repressor) of toxin-antitoxin stability system
VTATLEEAKADLGGLLRRLAPGEELTLTDNGTQVATVRAKRPTATGPRVPGLWVGKATIVTEDDEHLEHFAEYMK